MRILIFGDSITYGYNDTEGGWAERLRMTSVFEETDHSVYPLGISGDTTEGVLKRFEVETSARFRNEDSFIVLAIGTNDSQYLKTDKKSRYTTKEFRDNYSKLITLAKKHGVGVLILGLPPVDEVASKEVSEDKSWFESRTLELNNIIKELAEKESVPFVDVMKLFEENGGNDLLDDGLHPNTKGHELMYKEIEKKLRSILNI